MCRSEFKCKILKFGQQQAQNCHRFQSLSEKQISSTKSRNPLCTLKVSLIFLLYGFVFWIHILVLQTAISNWVHTTFFNKQIWLEIKSQLISKCLFVSSILPKNELGNSNFCPSLPGQTFFILFLEELKNTKCSFEINWI